MNDGTMGLLFEKLELDKGGKNETRKVEMKKIMNKWANLSIGVNPFGWGYSIVNSL